MPSAEERKRMLILEKAAAQRAQRKSHEANIKQRQQEQVQAPVISKLVSWHRCDPTYHLITSSSPHCTFASIMAASLANECY